MTEPENRPDPDALLRRLRAEDERTKRAKLRIYLGYAPGVGKTFAMLSVARELREQGVDVVVGLVESHGRYDTAALVLGLEVLPKRIVEHRGRKLEEFDLDAALARKPKILLVDELAHTNAEGSRHAKRWQDVLDVLDAGIDVHTTVNIQHLESLNDVIEQITTIRVRETVPDSILLRADEIELIDLPPEELLTRLKEGKVYLSEQAVRAIDNFFRRGNLLALRELALRRVADRVDQDVLAHRAEHEISRTWPTQERILVCIGPSPASARLVRAAARMAAGLRAPWVAGYVESTTIAPLGPAGRERLDAHLRLAESLGADIARLSGARVGDTLLEYARTHNVTRIIIGKPTHPRLRDWIRGSLLDEVVRGSGAIDVHVTSGDVEGGAPRAPSEKAISPRIDWTEYAWSAALMALSTGACGLGRTLFQLTDIAMLYLFAIMVVATRFGRGPSVLASALAVGAYDFFFIPPYYTFSVADARHTLTFLMMFSVGVVTSGLAYRIRRGEQEAREREQQTAALYALSRDLGAAISEGAASEAVAARSAQVFGNGAAVVVLDGSNAPRIEASSGEVPFDQQEQAVARWVLEHSRPAGLGTETLPGARISCFPLRSGASVLGVLALTERSAHSKLSQDRIFLDAYLRQAAMGLERTRLADDAKAAALLARTEEMRSSLLSAVSHDLRTPLAAITGAGSMLRDDSPRLSVAHRTELIDTICEEAERLERLVSSLLDMTRLESGSLKMRREWVPLEEIVVSASSRLANKLAERPLSIRVPDDLPLVSVDPVLFEQVFVNLLENAVKYTPAKTPVEISANVRDGRVVIDVADHGPGLPPGEESRVFEKFYRGRDIRAPGVGLGLAICRGIVEAHGGTIVAQNRPSGGALFRITLPVVGTAPALPAEGEPPQLSAVAS